MFLVRFFWYFVCLVMIGVFRLIELFWFKVDVFGFIFMVLFFILDDRVKLILFFSGEFLMIEDFVFVEVLDLFFDDEYLF